MVYFVMLIVKPHTKDFPGSITLNPKLLLKEFGADVNGTTENEFSGANGPL